MSTQVTSPTEAKSGLSAAFRPLFDAEFGYVCRALRRLGVRDADLQDVAQELFVTVHAQLAFYDSTRSMRSWLFSFAARFAANYRRLARHTLVVGDGEIAIGAAQDLASDPDRSARDLVLRALDKVDDERRIVVVMHDLEGFSAPEIAEHTSAPLNTVYSRLRVGRAEFRSAVEQLSQGTVS